MIISKTNTTPIKYFRDGEEITEAEYNKIFQIIQNRPIAPEGKGYKLTEDLQWELYELPTEETTEIL